MLTGNLYNDLQAIDLFEVSFKGLINTIKYGISQMIKLT